MMWLRIYVLIGMAIGMTGVSLTALGVGERPDTWGAVAFIGFAMAVVSAVRATIKDTPND